jgi:uncharacterized protein (DUF2147 family)
MLPRFARRPAGFLLASLCGALGLAGLARAAAPNDASGIWLTEDGRARVRTERCGPQNTNLCGYVVWGSKPLDDQGQPRVDGANPDPHKRTRLQLGHQLILGLKPNAEGHYEGKIYNADNGKSYDVQVWSDDPAALQVKGCMLAIFCGSQTWKRVTDVAPGQLTGPTNGPNGPRADAEWAPRVAKAPGR